MNATTLYTILAIVIIIGMVAKIWMLVNMYDQHQEEKKRGGKK